MLAAIIQMIKSLNKNAMVYIQDKNKLGLNSLRKQGQI